MGKMCNCDENQQHRTYQHTHQFTEEEDTICILVFNVKSSGAFCPGIWNSEQKWPEEIEVKLLNFSEESALNQKKHGVHRQPVLLMLYPVKINRFIFWHRTFFKKIKGENANKNTISTTAISDILSLPSDNSATLRNVLWLHFSAYSQSCLVPSLETAAETTVFSGLIEIRNWINKKKQTIYQL